MKEIFAQVKISKTQLALNLSHVEILCDLQSTQSLKSTLSHEKSRFLVVSVDYWENHCHVEDVWQDIPVSLKQDGKGKEKVLKQAWTARKQRPGQG